MNKSEIRALKKRRDEARRKAERFEQQAVGKSQFLQKHLLASAKQHRDETNALNAKLGQHA